MTRETSASHHVARRIADASGIPMPDDRLALFAASLDRNVEMMRTLLVIDFGVTEPAARFRPPPPA